MLLPNPAAALPSAAQCRWSERGAGPWLHRRGHAVPLLQPMRSTRPDCFSASAHLPTAAVSAAPSVRKAAAKLRRRTQALDSVPGKLAETVTGGQEPTQAEASGSSNGHVPAQQAAASSASAEAPTAAAPAAAQDLTAPATTAEQPEWRRLLGLGLPLMLQNVVGYITGIISMGYVGRLGSLELSAYVLASSVYNVTGLSVALGLSTGMDTLAGSAYGAGEYGKLGMVLQRALAVCWAACIPLALAWANSDTMLIALGQQPDIARLASRFLVLWVPCLFMSVLSECLRRYLQAQRQVKPLAISGLAGVVTAPLWFQLIMGHWKMGVEGSALAFLASQGTTLLGLLVAVVWQASRLRGSPNQTWLGLDLKGAFTGWGEFLRYALPAAIMICLEWWIFEAVVIMSGWLPDAGASLAAMGIAVTLNAWFYMLPMGLAASVNTSVGNALGAGSGANAARAFRAGLTLAVCLQATIAAGILLGGPLLVSQLCQDPAVRALTCSTLPVLSVVMVLDGLNSVVSGVLRGAGRQIMGAKVNLACCLLAVPAAWYLGFKADMGIIGFWAGVGLGAAVQFVVLISKLLPSALALGQQEKAGAGAAAASSSSSGSGSGWAWDWQAEADRLRAVVTAGKGGSGAGEGKGEEPPAGAPAPAMA